MGKISQELFGAESLQIAMKKFDADVKSHDLLPTEVAIRWIAHHSALGDHDGIILGASRVEQIRETITLLRKGPLSKELLQSTEELWNSVKESRKDVI